MSNATKALARSEEEATGDLARYDPQRFNILAPIVSVDVSDTPYLRQRAVVVKLDPDVNKGDCYAAPNTRWLKDPHTGELLPTHVAPAKPGLLKLASAMGIVWRVRRVTPSACERCMEMARATGQRQRCGDCPARYDVAYVAEGAVRSGTGWRFFAASYEWELEAQRRKIVREARKRLAKAQEEGKRFDLDEHVEDRLDQVIAERFGLAETKAILRLVRATGVRQQYTRDEFGRPFVAQRVELTPDFSDPAMREAFMRKALQSGAELFGAQTVETQGAPATVVTDFASDQPDFDRARAEGRVEEAAVRDEDDDGPEDLPEQVDDGPDEDSPAPAAAGELPLEGDPDEVRCDACNAVVPANVVAYCQSAKGRQAFGGANYCFRCQDKHRPRAGRGGAR